MPFLFGSEGETRKALPCSSLREHPIVFGFAERSSSLSSENNKAKRIPERVSFLLGAEGETRKALPCSSLREHPIVFGFAETSSSLSTENNKAKRIPERVSFLLGAEGETRTLAPVSRPTPLAGAPRHQLEYFCIGNRKRLLNCPQKRWRREWDSNPRYVAVRRFSRPFRYNHFGISAYVSLDILSHQIKIVNRFFNHFLKFSDVVP